MAKEYESIGKSLPVNKDAASDHHKDKLIRFLDCATIEFMHEYSRKAAAKQIETKKTYVAKAF